MIYIDPPYNTGNDDFIYNDNFKEKEADLIERYNLDEDSINYLSDLYKTKTHSRWLCFMYPRLKLARELLKEDGVIFVSIHDNEQANLKISSKDFPSFATHALFCHLICHHFHNFSPFCLLS